MTVIKTFFGFVNISALRLGIDVKYVIQIYCSIYRHSVSTAVKMWKLMLEYLYDVLQVSFRFRYPILLEKLNR